MRSNALTYIVIASVVVADPAYHQIFIYTPFEHPNYESVCLPCESANLIAKRLNREYKSIISSIAFLQVSKSSFILSSHRARRNVASSCSLHLLVHRIPTRVSFNSPMHCAPACMQLSSPMHRAPTWFAQRPTAPGM